ncbi:MAG: family 43 glycosylhydrolase [Prevotella sp.]|nr:family 43 glycosylhydrolase [Prevotella sp.]
MKKLFCLLCAGLLLAACGGSDGPGEDVVETRLEVEKPVVSDITTNSAKVAVTVKGSAITSRGVCYSKSANPTVNDTRVTGTSSAMSLTLSGLEAGTEYHVRGYAQTSAQVVYSEDVSFTTLAKEESPALDSWQAPAYADDYRSISSWDKRSQWNLANVHDPTVMLAEDGYYYMYQTDAGYGDPQRGHGHFHCRRSADLVNWEYLGSTMQSLPSWVAEKLNEIRAAMGLGASSADLNKCGYWAPCVRKVRNGLYRMYYVITIDGQIDGASTWSERAFIGLMETSNPGDVNSWQDKGYVITNYSDRELNYKVSPTAWQQCYFKYNAIDPSYIITPDGEHWLIYGSWHSGFAAVQLNAETGKTVVDPLPLPWGAENEAAYGKRIFTRKMGDRWQGSEAPEVVYHDGWYYLFLAYDALDVPYNTRVVRSRKIDGPYESINGTDVTNKGGEAYPIVTHPYKFQNSQGWVGISHCAVFDDGKGNWYYASQQRFPTTAGGNAPNAVMVGGVRSILWLSNGWPVVMPERYAAVPQVAIAADDIVGIWEHIDLSYKYGEMKSSTAMTFAADGTITDGPWKGGKWSFNASTSTLTANGVELKVQRECDWEASPRTHTIVYAGVNDTKTYWGKKK